MNLMKELARNIEVDDITGSVTSSRETTERHWADPTVEFPYRDDQLDPVCALLQRPYFERTWIRQEIYHAKHAIVQCEREEMRWEDFGKFIICVGTKNRRSDSTSAGKPNLFIKMTEQAYALWELTQTRCSYDHINLYMRMTKCKNQRDKAIRSTESPMDARPRARSRTRLLTKR